MSKKYINADALIKSLATETGCMDRVFHAMDVADMVKNFPAADVVEVVRCRDCKHSAPNGVYGCTLERFSAHDKSERLYSEDYCSYGERKKALPSAQPEQRWVPCSERLPVQNGVYVVTRTISDRFEYNNITDCCYFDGTNTWHDDTRVNHGRKYLADVIAWQPLPEPYKADMRGEDHESDI